MWYSKENLHWNGEKCLFFIHNQRCAGTRANMLLSEHYLNSFFKLGYKLSYNQNEAVDRGEANSARTGIDKLRMQLTDAARQGCSYIAAGHFGIDFVDSLANDGFVITNFRHPYNRYISCCTAFGKQVLKNPFYLYMFVSNFTGRQFSTDSPPTREDVDLAIGRLKLLDGLLDQSRFSVSLAEIERSLNIGPLISLFGPSRKANLAGDTGKFVRLSEDGRKTLLARLARDIEVYDEMSSILDRRLRMHPYDEKRLETREALWSIFNAEAWKKQSGIPEMADFWKLTFDQVVATVSGMVKEGLIQNPQFHPLMDDMRDVIAKLTIYSPNFRRAVDTGIESGISATTADSRMAG